MCAMHSSAPVKSVCAVDGLWAPPAVPAVLAHLPSPPSLAVSSAATPGNVMTPCTSGDALVLRAGQLLVILEGAGGDSAPLWKPRPVRSVPTRTTTSASLGPQFEIVQARAGVIPAEWQLLGGPHRTGMFPKSFCRAETSAGSECSGARWPGLRGQLERPGQLTLERPQILGAGSVV